MLKKLSEQLYHSLQKEIQKSTTRESPMDKLKTGLDATQKALIELKIAVTNNGFADSHEEICFFKIYKPRIYCYLIFFTEQYAISRNVPLLGQDDKHEYYLQQLKFLSRFFRQHEFLYQYFKLGAEELDEKYFLRSAKLISPAIAEVPEVDPSFATAADYLFSKFMAYEMLQEFLLSEIAEVSASRLTLASNLGHVKWTGESCNLIEVIYGIYETKQINEGNTTLSELMDFFGQALQINLIRYYKRFADIKRRKSVSKTRFLEEMAEKVNKRIEDGDAWVPPMPSKRDSF